MCAQARSRRRGARAGRAPRGAWRRARPAATPRSCSACISCLRCVFDGDRSVLVGGRRGVVRLHQVDVHRVALGVHRAAKCGSRGHARHSRVGLCYDSRRFVPHLTMTVSANAVTRQRFDIPPAGPGDGESHFPGVDRRARARGRGRARCRARGRRDGGRDRSVAGGRPERDRAQGRGRDDRVQPRQGHRRHRLRRRSGAATRAPPISPTTRFAPRSTRRSRSRATRRRIRAPGSPIRSGSRARWPDLDLYHPWELAGRRRRSRSAAKRKPRRWPSTRASPTAKARRVSRGESEFVYANTHGFSGGYRSSRHHIDCAVIGEADGAMQRDYWYTAARAPRRPAARGRSRPHRRRAHGAPARRAPARHARMPGAVRGARGRPTCIGSFVHAVSGGSLYRKSSFLLDSLGTAGVRAARERSARSRTCCARAAARRSTTKAWRPTPRDVVARRRAAGLFPRQLLRAQARACSRPATPAAATTSSSPGHRRSAGADAADGHAACSSPSSWGRASIR